MTLNLSSTTQAQGTPFPHIQLPNLLPPSLLSSALREIRQELRFTRAESDIFRYSQTGDLWAIHTLEGPEAKRIENLITVKHALFSSEVRDYLEKTLDCGKLAEKGDLCVTEYAVGDYLLPHGESEGTTRRVAFLFELSRGGEVRLYGNEEDEKVVKGNVGDFMAMRVWPGEAVHSVPELRSGSPRLVLSGWFHAEGSVDSKGKGKQTPEPAPTFTPYDESADPPLPGTPLSASDTQFLSRWLNPSYLSRGTQQQLFQQFGDSSHILLADVLRKDVAKACASVKDGARWDVAGPPRKRRYQVLRDVKGSKDDEELPLSNPPVLLHLLRTTLLPSRAFRHFLANITQLVPISHRPFEVRRFRAGEGYSTASVDEDDVVLDVCFGFTRGGEDEKHGGWDVYLAPSEGDDEGEAQHGHGVRVHKSKAAREQELADAAMSARERFDVELEAQERTSSTQRQNLTSFTYQYVTLSLTGTTPTKEQLHTALTKALLALHGTVNGSFHVDILHLEEGMAVLRVESSMCSRLTSAIAATLRLEGTHVAVMEVGNAFTMRGGENGSRWLNDLDVPSGKRRRVEVEQQEEEQADAITQSAEEDDEGDEEAAEEDEDEDEDSDSNDESEPEPEPFDGTLLTLPPSHNTLSIVLRDEGVVHFVQYRSGLAPTHRLDVVAQFGVGRVEVSEGEGGTDGEDMEGDGDEDEDEDAEE